MYGVDVVIHHLNAPRYVIKNNVEKDCDSLMLSYHDGEHYNSVKNIRDIDSGKQVCKCKLLKQNKSLIVNNAKMVGIKMKMVSGRCQLQKGES